MKKKEMEKTIKRHIKSGTDENPVNREDLMVTLLTAGCKVSAAMTAITKAFKEAGIIAVSSTSALKEARDWLKGYIADEEYPGLDNFKEMRELATDMQEKFSVNDDDEKGIRSGLKLIKDVLAANNLDIPKKIHLGVVKALTIDYFLDAQDNGNSTSISGLADYLVDNIEGGKEDASDETIKKLKITAGTDYNFAYMMLHRIRLENIN